MGLSILQLNCNHAAAASDLLGHLSRQRDCALTLISDPYMAWLGAQLGRPYPTVLADLQRTSCIYPLPGTIVTDHGAGDHFVWADVASLGRVVSCYFPPSVRFAAFQGELDQIAALIQGAPNGRLLIGGDFNAHSPLWGSINDVVDERGQAVQDWLSTHDLTTLNDGVHPTFDPGTRSSPSYIDLTVATAEMVPACQNWQVLHGISSESDHRLISHEWSSVGTIPSPPTRRPKVKAKDGLAAALLEHLDAAQPTSAQQLNDAVSEVWKQQTYVTQPKEGQICRSTYWWNDKIAELWKACNRSRRVLTRTRALPPTGFPDPEHYRARVQRAIDAHREARRLLRREIKASKRECWNSLIELVELTPWGKPYQLVRGKFSKPPERAALNAEGRLEILTDLFPRATIPYPTELARLEDAYHREGRALPTSSPVETPPVSKEEIEEAASRARTGRAPGPDLIPGAVVKGILANRPELCAKALDSMLRGDEPFPEAWKAAEAVLIPKPKGGYRPISLLTTLAKSAEAVIDARLREHLESGGHLSEAQHGFRKRRSCLTAIDRVVQFAQPGLDAPVGGNPCQAIVLLDVQNAFNTIEHVAILRALVKRDCTPSMVRLINSYLWGRTISPQGENPETSGLPADRGVPQGSVLGPLLWIVAYDDVLRLPLLQGVELVCYADDLAVLVKANDWTSVRIRANDAIAQISAWMATVGLKLAPAKCEWMSLSGKRKATCTIVCDGVQVRREEVVRYLGVHLDPALSGLEHIRRASAKALGVAQAVARLFPNTRGATVQKRVLLATVAKSIALYACPVWPRKSLGTDLARDLLRKAQRPMALRVLSAYRTVSTNAALVLSRSRPWDLHAKALRRAHVEGIPVGDALHAANEEWQREWSSIPAGSPGARVRDIIQDVNAWWNLSHVVLDFFTTQIVTEHGDFGSYLHRIGKWPTAECRHCDGGVDDTPEHTVMRCPAWTHLRSRRFNGDNLIAVLQNAMRTPEEWGPFAETVRAILGEKMRTPPRPIIAAAPAAAVGDP